MREILVKVNGSGFSCQPAPIGIFANAIRSGESWSKFSGRDGDNLKAGVSRGMRAGLFGRIETGHARGAGQLAQRRPERIASGANIS